MSCSGLLLMMSAKPAWKFNAAMFALFGLMCDGVAFAYWVWDTDRFFKKMQQTAFWPYGRLDGYGFKLICGGIGGMSIGVLMELCSSCMGGSSHGAASAEEA